MAIKQSVWSLDTKKELPTSSLNNEEELENLITENISLLNNNWFVIGRQVRTAYGGIIDLLCIDAGGNLIVVELKKNLTPREVTAQVLDYASWVNKISDDDLAQIYLDYTNNEKNIGDAFKERFGIELSDNNDDSDIQMVIVAVDMDGSTERIIKYLQEYSVNINVLFFNVFEQNGERFLSRAWMVEPDDVSITITKSSKEWNGEYYCNFLEEDVRSWDDAVKYGFVSAGGGSWFTGTMLKLNIDDRIWVNTPKKGYAGVGIVTGTARPARETSLKVGTDEVVFFELPLIGNYSKDAHPETEEYVLPVKWIKTVPLDAAYKEIGFFGNQNTVCQPKADKWEFTVRRLKELWKID